MSQEYSEEKNDDATTLKTSQTITRDRRATRAISEPSNGAPPFWKLLLKDLLVTVVGVSLLGIFLTLIPLVAIGFCLGGCAMIGDSSDAEIIEEVIDGSENAKAKIAVLPIEGTIMSDSVDAESFWTKSLKLAIEDDDVKALVLRVNSPGGSVSGSAYYHRLVKRVREKRNIPVVVSMGDIAASGGYYISAAADEIFAEPSTWTGSIGVICPSVNAAELCKKIGARSSSVASGPMKDMGNFMREPTEEETAVWQNLVNDSYEQFLSVVREGRAWFRAEDVDVPAEKESALKERDAELRKIADGRIYSANQALALRLVDKIGYLDDAIDSALERANLTKDSACVVVYTEPDTLLSTLGLEAQSQGTPFEKIGKAFESMAAPKAYYLCPNALPF